MTRVILTVGCLGKTYADENYSNVYDFDKHTLKYKYDLTDFENYSNEKFKELHNQKIKNGWFEQYMHDWCQVIDSGEYDIVIGLLQEDCVNYLLEKGYEIELIIVDAFNNPYLLEILGQRVLERGNSQKYLKGLREYYQTKKEQYQNAKNMKIWVISTGISLTDILLFTGSTLIDNVGNIISYVDRIRELVAYQFSSDKLSDDLLSLYAQIVLIGLELGSDACTNRIIHNAWALASPSNHVSNKVFNALSEDVQELDTKYTDGVWEIIKDLHIRLLGLGLIGKSGAFIPHWYFTER